MKFKPNDYLTPLSVIKLIAETEFKQSPLDNVTMLGYNGKYDIVICRNNIQVYTHSEEITLCNEYYLSEFLYFDEEDTTI